MNNRNLIKGMIISAAVITYLCLPAYAMENLGAAAPETMREVGHSLYIQLNEENNLPPAGILGTINTGGVNFREDASENSLVLDTLSSGREVAVLLREGDWCKISYGGRIGCIKSAQVSSCGLPLDCTEGQVIGGAGEIRQTPDNEGPLVIVVNEGAKLYLLSLENGWYSVTCGMSSGYIRADHIKADSSADDTLFKVPADIGQASCEAEQSNWGDQVVAKAKEYLGVSYVYGGSTPSGFDCSGFTMYVYGQMGQAIPHSATSQWSSVGTAVDRSDLQPGDLVFFKDPSRSKGKACSHVGLYIGNGEFIHAASGSSSGRQVRISSLSESYYDRYYKGAKRI